MDIDETTRMPALPENYRWSIRDPNPIYPDCLRIVLEKRRVSRWLKREVWDDVQEEWCNPFIKFEGSEWAPTPEEWIIRTADHALEKEFPTIQYDFSEWIGTYPPKKLGDTR